MSPGTHLYSGMAWYWWLVIAAACHVVSTLGHWGERQWWLVFQTAWPLALCYFVGGLGTEIILALSADVEGEATTNYLAETLAPLGVPLTRIAHGLPAGGGLEHADALTLQRALSGRNPLRVDS